MATSYLSLGTNLGRRKNNLTKAINLIEECGIKVIKKSSVYNTQPVSKISQRNYYNMCLEISTNHNPQKLLTIFKLIEKQMGRPGKRKKVPNAAKPRIIDIDILLYENKIINKRNLRIPHKELHIRKFILEPLNEIAPQIKHPMQQKTVNQLLKECYKSDYSNFAVTKLLQ